MRTWTSPHGFIGILLGGLMLGGAAVCAQSALNQVGYDEESAHELLLKNLGDPRGQAGNLYISTAIQKIPKSARGPLTTQLYAWTKAHMSSPAFQKAYAAWREENHPVEKKHDGTLDQEVKARLAQQRTEADASYKDLLGAGMKTQAEQFKKQFETTIGMMEPGIRLEVQEARAKDPADYALAMKFWQEYYPVDPLVNVAKHLREYLAVTADVDFTAKQVQRTNGIGELEWFFVNETYNKKPWQWKASYNYGAEGTVAARAAAAAWLKEMGR